MKKFLIALALLLGIGFAGQAESMGSVFDKLASEEGAKKYDQVATEKILSELNSNLTP